MGKEKSLEEIEAELAAMEAELAALSSGKAAPPPKKEKGGFLKKKEAPPEPTPEPAAPEAPAEAPPAAEPAAPEAPAPEPAAKAGLLSRFKKPKAEAPPEAPPAEADESPSKLSFLGKLKRGKGEAPPAVAEPAPPAADPVPAAPAVPEEPEQAAPPARVHEPGPAVAAPPPAPVERIPPPTGQWVQEGKSWRRVAGGPPAVAPEPGALPPGALPPSGPEDAPVAEPGKRRRFLWVLVPLAVLLLAAVVLAASSALLGDGTAPGATTTPPANVTTPAGDVRAAFAMSPVRATNGYKVNEAISFNAASTVVPAGEAATYGWDFGDGTKGTGRQTTKAFAKPGSYTVTLTVTVAGTPASVAKVVKVVPPPTANLAATKGGAPVGVLFPGDTVDFDASASNGTGNLTYAWDFGEGVKATGATASFSFQTAGRHTVTLTVTDGNGVPATRSKVFYVGLRQSLSESVPASTDGAKTVSIPFNVAPGNILPTAIRANITYQPAVQGGAGGLGLPVPVDELTLVLRDAAGTEVARGAGANGAARLELTSVDPAAIGQWTLEVTRAQGGTAAKPFTGTLEIELPPAP